MKRTDGEEMQYSAAKSAILHDAYFNKKPSFIMLIMVRLALVCALSGSIMWSLTDLYLMPEDQLVICMTAAGAAAALFILASLLPSGVVYTAALAGGAFVCWIMRGELKERFEFFWDGMMVRLDSRLLKTEALCFHRFDIMKQGAYKEQTANGTLFCLLLLALIVAIYVTASARTRFHPFNVLFLFALLSAPAFAAEISGFHFSIVLFISVFAALQTVNMGYELDGKLVFGRSRPAREALRSNEHSYRRRTRFYTFGKKLYSDLPRYFKYTANSFLAMLITAGILFGAAHYVPDGQGFDYKSIFSAVQDAGVSIVDSVGGTFGVTFGTIEDNGYFSYSDYGDDSGGIGISEPAKGNLPVLDVTLDRRDISVYLRGDIGVRFSGDSWTVIRDEYGSLRDPSGERYEDIFSGFYTDMQYQVLRQRLSSLGYNPDRLFPLQDVSVSYRRNTKVVFQPLAPYELDYMESEDYDCFGDYVLRTKDRKNSVKSYEILSLTPYMSNYYMSEAVTAAQYSRELDWTLPNGMSVSEYSSAIEKYDEYVRNMYTSSDEEIIAPLVQDMYRGGYIGESGDYVGAKSEFDTASGICRYFKENFTYSLEADNGSGRELLSSFLYKTKEGHCALFASAMVLAMRYVGIPARYITGYVVSGTGEKTPGGRYSYTLRENDLHAWVEVYFENVGWLPFDPTAAIRGFGNNPIAAPPAESEDEDTERIEITEPPEDDTEPEITTTVPEGTPDESTATTTPPEEGGAAGDGTNGGTDDGTDDGEEGGEEGAPAQQPPSGGTPQPHKESFGEIFARILPYLTFGLIAAAVLAALTLFVRGVKKAEESAISGFKKKPTERAVAEMYRLVIMLLSSEGLAPGAETLTDYAVRADSSALLKGANVFLTDVMPIFSKCEFGKPEISPVTEEERFAAYQFTMALYRRIMDKKNFISKFLTKISLFL